MRRRLLILAVLLALPAPAYALVLAENPKLSATVGPGYNISLTDAAGNPVTRLDTGPYDITVRDLSNEHNFHLYGPGVDEFTSVVGTGTFNWTVTFRDGHYTFVCDPHSTDMRGTFPAGNPPPEQPKPIPSTPTRLTAAVGPANTIFLKNAAGANVRTLKAGRYAITVRDRTKVHNFHLVGTQLNRKTTLAGMGTFTWNVTLRRGKLLFYSDAAKLRLRKTVTIT